MLYGSPSLKRTSCVAGTRENIQAYCGVSAERQASLSVFLKRDK